MYGRKDIRYDEIEMPVIKKDEILVKVNVTGICGSDIPRVLGDAAHYYPIVLGHEFSGEVVETGREVDNVKTGDRISGAPLLPCHRCDDCMRGHFSQCKHYSFIGSRVNGSWAEYVKMPGKNAVRLPEEVSFIQGAFFEPTTVALHGLFVMGFKGGYDAAIVGMGTIGLLTLQCARIMGAKRIFAFDIDSRKLDIASKYGADVCINTMDDSFSEKIEELTRNRGFEMVIETAGVEYTEKLCLEIAANKGNIMFIGTPSRPVTFQPREFEHINRKELTVRGSWMSYSAPFPGREWELAGYYFSKGLIRAEKLIDRIVPIQDVTGVFKDFEIPGNVKGKILFAVS